MELNHIPEESKPGYYDVFTNSGDGKKYIVLNGLNPTDIHEPGVLEQWTHKHYDQMELAYWILFLTTFSYLLATYIIVPVYAKLKNQLWPSTQLGKKL